MIVGCGVTSSWAGSCGLVGRWPVTGYWRSLTGRRRSRRWPGVGCRVRVARAACCGSRRVSPPVSPWIWAIVYLLWTRSTSIWLLRLCCIATAVAVRAGRRDEHGADHPGASSHAGQAAAGAGATTPAGAVGVAGGAAGWQQVADPGGVDRPGWRGCRGGDRHGGVGLVGAVVARVHGGSRAAGTGRPAAGAGCTAVAVRGGPPCSLCS